MTPLIAIFGTKGRWVVDFTLRPGKKLETGHPLHESVGELQWALVLKCQTKIRTRTYTYKLEVNNKLDNLTPPGTSSHPQSWPVLLLKPDSFLPQDMCFISFCSLQLRIAVHISHCVKSLKVNSTDPEVRLNNAWNASSCLEREHCIANMMTSRSMLRI